MYEREAGGGVAWSLVKVGGVFLHKVQLKSDE